MRNPEQIFSPSRLLDRLWTADEFPTEGAVRAHIKGLRNKLKQAGSKDILETIYKQGYRLKPLNVLNQDVKEDIISASVTSASVSSELKAVWEKYRQSYSDRLSIIEQAITALETGSLTPKQQHKVEREAHTLIGSLGCFGLDQSSQISRQIQQIFQQETELKLTEIEKLRQLLRQLKQQIEEFSVEEQAKCLPSNSTITYASLLIVDDDLILAQQIAAEAKNWGFNTKIAVNIQQAQLSLKENFDVILLDINFPDSSENGLDFLAMVRKNHPKIPVVMLTAEDTFDQRVEVPVELLTRVRTRLEQRKLWKMTEIDALTGLSLRRKAVQELTRLFQLAQRQKQSFSLAILDLDHFKSVNDKYGHEIGDRVLNYFGKLLNQSFRQEDIVGRWGGEEFVVGMYGTTKEDGIKRLAQVLQDFSKYSFTILDGTKFQVTFSGGIAQAADDANDLQILYQKADMALYQAKELGRNCICAATSG